MGRAFMQGFGILALALAFQGSAEASPGKVKKAAKLQAAYEQGDRAALVEALGVLELAIEHPKVAHDPAAWARLGHLRFEAAKAASDADGFADAASDLGMALELGADGPVRSSVVSDLKTIMGKLYTSAFDAMEAKRFDEAESLLASLLAVRESLADVSEEVKALEDRLLSLAVRVMIQHGELDDALGYQASLTKRGFFDAGISSYLAKELAAAGRRPDALALLTDLALDYPSEPRLLRTDIDLRVEADDVEGALARIDGQKETLWRSVSGALLLAELYGIAGLDVEQFEALARVLEQDPNHLDGNLAVARDAAARGDADQVILDAGGRSYHEKKALRTTIADNRTEAVLRFEKAFRLAPTRFEIGEELAKAHEAIGDEEAARGVRDQIASEMPESEMPEEDAP